MPFSNPSKLQALFWEIKNRFFYIGLSFFLSFTISYQNSASLLYLFVLSYRDVKPIQLNKKNDYFLTFFDNVFNKSEKIGEKFNSNESPEFVSPFTFPQRVQGDEIITFVRQLSESDLLCFSNTLKSIDISSINFIFTDVEEAFSSQILVCFIFSFVSIAPILIYESFSFFLPSLYSYESKKWIFRTLSLIIVWCFFMYNVQNKIIPKLAEFLLQFQISGSSFNIVAETKIYSYCTWASTIFIIANCFFFFIVSIFFLIVSEKLQIEYFFLHRKWCRIIALLISALFSPPDLSIQLLLFVMLITFFELFIYFFCFYKHFLVYSEKKF